MNFNKWVLKETPRKVAKALGVDPSSVCAWQSGKSCPRPDKMRAIQKLSRGRVTYADMIDYHLDSKTW